MSKKKKYAIGIRFFLRLILSIVMLLMPCSVINAKSSKSDIKWYYGSKEKKEYRGLLPSTFKYDADSQIASFVECKLHEYDKDNASLIIRFIRISFKRKATSSFYVGKTKLERKKNSIFQTIDYNKKIYDLKEPLKKMEPIEQQKFLRQMSSKWTPIGPDTVAATRANKIASLLHIKPMYPKNPNRWRLIHSDNKSLLYIATDSLSYDNQQNRFFVWTEKRDIAKNSGLMNLYSVDFSTNQLCNISDSQIFYHPYPESDGYYIYEAAKELAQSYKATTK